MRVGKGNAARAALLAAMCSVLSAGCVADAAIGLLAANEADKASMPPPESLTAAALGVTSDKVTIHGKVDYQGNFVEGRTARWTASTSDGKRYACEYVGTVTNCVPS